MSGEVTRTILLSAVCRSIWQPTPQYGQTARTIDSGRRICSGRKRSLGSTSKIAPVGHTRTHSPHQVQPALSGSPSAPTMISVCSPRWPTSSTPTTWMSSQARTQRVHRMQVVMSWRIIGSPGRSSPERSDRSRAPRRRGRDAVAHHVLARTRCAGRPARRRAAGRRDSAPAASASTPLRFSTAAWDSVVDHHAIGDLGGAGGQELGLALHRHEADAAVADDRELGVPAERRDLDAGRAGGVEDRLVGFGAQRAAVDRQRDHTRNDRRWLRVRQPRSCCHSVRALFMDLCTFSAGVTG